MVTRMLKMHKTIMTEGSTKYNLEEICKKWTSIRNAGLPVYTLVAKIAVFVRSFITSPLFSDFAIGCQGLFCPCCLFGYNVSGKIFSHRFRAVLYVFRVFFRHRSR